MAKSCHRLRFRLGLNIVQILTKQLAGRFEMRGLAVLTPHRSGARWSLGSPRQLTRSNGFRLRMEPSVAP